MRKMLKKISNAINLLCVSLFTAMVFGPARVFAGNTTGNTTGGATAGDPDCPKGFKWDGNAFGTGMGGCMPEGGGGNLDSSASNILGTMSRVSNYIAAGAIIIGVIYTIYSGIKIMTSSGNPQKKQMAKDSLFSVVIGLAIVGAAALIASIAFGLLQQ